MHSRTLDETAGPSEDSEPAETLTGLGTWIGIAESPLDASQPTAEASCAAEQIERYRWFERRIAAPRRPVDQCLQALRDPPPTPAAREAAMVELSLIGTTRARVALERWHPPDDDAALRTFRRVCIAELDSTRSRAESLEPR